VFPHKIFASPFGLLEGSHDLSDVSVAHGGSGNQSFGSPSGLAHNNERTFFIQEFLESLEPSLLEFLEIGLAAFGIGVRIGRRNGFLFRSLLGSLFETLNERLLFLRVLEERLVLLDDVDRVVLLSHALLGNH